MAEAILPVVLEKAATLMAAFAREEHELQRGLSRELASIKRELEFVEPFLREAEDRADADNGLVRAWVGQVRNVAYRIEDVVDKHTLLLSIRLRNRPRDRCLRLSYRATRFLAEMKLRHDLGSSIATIKAEVLEIQRRRTTYDLTTTVVEGGGECSWAVSRSWKDPRIGFLYPKGSELVGTGDPTREVLGMLEAAGTGVVAMVGMGGIGKTTLAWKLHEHAEVRRRFYVRAWVNVTQNYVIEEVLRGMAREFYKAAVQAPPPELGQMDEMRIVAHLREFLHDKRCIVVFDDVWHPGLWHNIKIALPDNGKGNKIVLTTRQENVALTWRSPSTDNHIYRLELLPPVKAWELFCNKAFQGLCPSWLEGISCDIVDKCKGLPLALVTIGGLLSTKEKSFAEWRDFRDTLSKELDRHPELMNISRLLLLSYNDLPCYLKPCILYFAMFPSGSTIDCNRLLRLWIAEDFIKRDPREAVEIEDVARNCLLELIQRSLVQVSLRHDCGRAKTICVHDLIHVVLRSKLKELDFCQVLDKENPEAEVDMRTRRLSVSTSLPATSRHIVDKCEIRSLLIFGSHETPACPLPNSLIKRVYLLKVLDLQSAPLDRVPNEIGNLLLLQYLSLRYTKIRTIPKTIGRLHNLLTLDLKRCPISDLPVEIRHLRKLRHFVVYQNTWHNIQKVWVIGAVAIPGRAMENLVNLQKLADVNVAESIGFMDQLSTFKKLRYLAIFNVKKENSLALCKAIGNLEYLESLNVTVDYESVDPIDLQHVASPPVGLRRLYLIGPLIEFPEWIGKLMNLNKLRLRGSRLEALPLESIDSLPNLTMVGFNKDAYYGERLVFRAGKFRRLRAMYLDWLPKLGWMEIEKGALQHLEELLIRRSPKLKELPIGLDHLEKLSSLKLVEMPPVFVESLRRRDYHVADIRVGYQTPAGVRIYEKL